MSPSTSPATPDPTPDFVFSLRDNAIDSLEHGLEHFLTDEPSARDLKATIIHVFHALELFLKAALAKVHRNLIFSRIDEGPIRDGSHTVSFEKLLWRLQNFDVDLSDEAIKHLKSLQFVRNSIEHHKVAGRRDDVERYISHAIAFLEEFLPEHLAIELKGVLKADQYSLVQERVYSYDQRLALATQRLERDIPMEAGEWSDKVAECPECGEEVFSLFGSTTEKDRGECYFCGATEYVAFCGRCHRLILGSEPWTEENAPGLCSDCLEDLIERH